MQIPIFLKVKKTPLFVEVIKSEVDKKLIFR